MDDDNARMGRTFAVAAGGEVLAMLGWGMVHMTAGQEGLCDVLRDLLTGVVYEMVGVCVELAEDDV